MLTLPGIPAGYRWVYKEQNGYPVLRLEQLKSKNWVKIYDYGVYTRHYKNEQEALTKTAEKILYEVAEIQKIKHNPNYGVYQSFRTGP